MQATGSFTSDVLTQGTQGLAALAAERLISEHPDIATRYRPGAIGTWRESLSTRLGYLAAAISTGRPAVFAAQVSWAKIAVRARMGEIGVRDLRAALVALRQTLLDELPTGPAESAVACLDGALKAFDALGAEGPSTLSVDTPRGKLAADYLLAILEGDRHRACTLVMDQVRAGGLNVRQAYMDVITPVQQELGRMWHMNESTVAEEHFCTATTQMLMSQLYTHLPRAQRNGRRLVAASVEGNAHDLGVRMIADELESIGWKSVYLGASVPPDDLALAVSDFGADLLCLSAGIATQLPTVRKTVQSVRAGPLGVPSTVNTRVKILVGGGAFSSVGDAAEAERVARELGADAYARSLDDAALAVKKLFDV